MNVPEIGKVRAALKRKLGALPFNDQVPSPVPTTDPYAGLRDGLSSLSDRARKVRKLSTSLTGTLLIAAVLIAGFMVASYICQPPDSLPKLHIPEHIQALYDRSTEGPVEQPSRSFGSSSGVGSLSVASAGVFEFMNGTLLRVLAGMMVLVGIVGGVLRQSIMSFATGVGGGVMLYNIPIVISSLLGGPSLDVEEHVERVEAKELRAMRPSAMLTTLKALKGVEAGEISYILGQAAIRNDKPESAYVDEAAEFIRSGKATFVIPQSIAYVVEMASDRTVQSPQAKQLQADKAKTLSRIQALRDPLTVICLVLGLCLAVVAGFGQFMSQRVKRIGKMLDQLT